MGSRHRDEESIAFYQLSSKDKLESAMSFQGVDELPRVEVILGGAIESLKGKQWPKSMGEPVAITGIDTPCRIAATFPSGLQLTSRSQTVFFSQTKGLVREVDVMPLEGHVEFLDAVKAVEVLATSLNLDKQSRLYEAIAEWKKSPPNKMGVTDRFIRVLVEKDVALRVEIKFRETVGKWSLVAEFTIPSLFGVPQPNP